MARPRVLVVMAGLFVACGGEHAVDEQSLAAQCSALAVAECDFPCAISAGAPYDADRHCVGEAVELSCRSGAECGDGVGQVARDAVGQMWHFAAPCPPPEWEVVTPTSPLYDGVTAIPSCNDEPASECRRSVQTKARPLSTGGVGRQLAYIGADFVDETELAPDARSPLGFSAKEVLAAYEGTHEGAFKYLDGSPATGISVSIVDRGGPYIFQDWQTYNGNDGIIFPVDLKLQTEDGAFNEAGEAELHAHAALRSMVWLELEVSRLVGNYAYSTPSGPQRSPGSALMVVELSPACGVEGRFTLLNASPEFEGHPEIGTF